MSKLSFIKTALKDYKVGALTPTSRFVIRKIVTYIKPEYKYFVEYGPGDGILTKELLKKVPRDGKLVAIELNKDFFEELQKIKDPRFLAINGDIVEYSRKLNDLGMPRVDMVISSVPFSFFKPEARNAIIQNTYNNLVQGGAILVYQYRLLMKPIIQKVFNNFSYHIEPRNFPPYFIMTAEKR